MNESQLIATLQGTMDKLMQEEHPVSIAIYGGSEEAQMQLAKAVFGGESCQNFCQFFAAGEDLAGSPAHAIWAFEDVAEPTAPCYRLQGFSPDEIKMLISFTAENLSGGVRKSFVKRQILDLDLKEKAANTLITQHCAGAFGVGFVPIPFANAPILVSNEIALMGRILDIYGLSDVQAVIKTVGISTLVGNLLTMAGRGLVGELLKCIPGIGTVVGGLIYGGSATAVTLAFGKAVSKAVKQLCKSAAENNMRQVRELGENFAQIVAGTAVKCIEEGKKTGEDYRNFDKTEFSYSDLMRNVERGNELFQQFLDRNAELDNDFAATQEKSKQASDDMWAAINNI